MIIRIIAAIGFLLSFYGWYVERQARSDKDYKAVCDISESMSCTNAFTSEYGKLISLSNSVWGMLFYSLVILLAFHQQMTAILGLAAFAVLGSVYLAYIQYIRMKNFCLVCTAIYLVNVALLVASL